MKRARLDERGVTLVEVIVVVVLIAIMTAIGLPDLFFSNPLRSLEATAKAVYSDIQYARLMAVRDNRPYYVDFSGSHDIDNDGQTEFCIVWRDLENVDGAAYPNGTFNTTDNDGDGVADEVHPAEIISLGNNPCAYGKHFEGVAKGSAPTAVGGPSTSPLGEALPGDGAIFTNPRTGVADTQDRLRVESDGTSYRGTIYMRSTEGAGDLTYAIWISPTGGAELWRYIDASVGWERR